MKNISENIRALGYENKEAWVDNDGNIIETWSESKIIYLPSILAKIAQLENEKNGIVFFEMTNNENINQILIGKNIELQKRKADIEGEILILSQSIEEYNG